MFRFGKQLSTLVARQFHNAAKLPPLNELVDKINANNVSEKYEEALKKFEGRIWFNSVLEVQSVRLKQYDKILTAQERRKEVAQRREVKTLPLVLNQLYDNAVSNLENKHNESDLEELVEESKERKNIFILISHVIVITPYMNYLASVDLQALN